MLKFKTTQQIIIYLEILTDPHIQNRLMETKAAGEIKALDSFYQMLQNEPNRAFYGLNHVEKAMEVQGIETLLISDKLFRSNDIDQRKRCVNLVESVKEFGGEVKLFSSLHVSGERMIWIHDSFQFPNYFFLFIELDLLTGVAAILRFPMPELDSEDSDDTEWFDDDASEWPNYLKYM